MEHNVVSWFEIYVQDMIRAKAFYETVFSVTLEALDSPGFEMWGFPMFHESPGAMGALVKMPGVLSGGNSTIVYFGSKDCSIEEARITSSNGKISKSKMPIGKYGFITLAIDPDGNMLGIHSTE